MVYVSLDTSLQIWVLQYPLSHTILGTSVLIVAYDFGYCSIHCRIRFWVESFSFKLRMLHDTGMIHT